MKTLCMCLFFIGSFSLQAYDSGVKKWGNTLQVMLPDPKVDFSLRLKAISEAKKSIEMISYSLTTTGVLGPHFVSALQKALDRGVKGSFFITMSGLSGSDLSRPLERFLLRPGDHSEIYNALSPRQVERSWGSEGIDLLDAFHEKILIIDRDTPFEKIWFGGRGISDFDLLYLDFAYMTMPLDASKPYLGTLIKEAYDRVTKEIRAGIRPVKIVKAKDVLSFSTLDPLVLTSEQEKKMVQIEKKADFENTFFPESYRLLSNDYFKRLREGSYDKSFSDLDQRDEKNTSSLALFYRDVLGSASDIILTTMYYFPPKEIRKALEKHLEEMNGASVRILVNSKESSMLVAPSPFAFYYSLEHLIKISEQARIFGGREKTCLLKNRASDKFEKYMHLKILYTDQQVVVGSHNHNLASEHRNNETVTVFYDNDIRKWFHSFLEQKISDRFVCLTPQQFRGFYIKNMAIKHTTFNGSSLNRFLDDLF
jgi:phosphatidylserine/phosphatidylglycerophosphate/cardiolipin synthase-like enzyme